MKSKLGSTRSGRALSGLLADYFGAGVNIVLSLLITPWLVFLLEPELFGFWVVAAQVLLWINILDGGSGVYLTKAIAGQREDPARAVSMVNTVFFVYVALAAVTLLIGWNVAPFVCEWAQLSGESAAAGTLAFRISVISAVIALVLGPTFQAILFGFQKLALMNSIVSGVAAFGLVLGLVFLLMGGGIVWLAGAQLIGTLLGAVITIALARRLLPVTISPSAFDRGELREVFRFVSYFQMSKVAFVANNFSDGILIAGMNGTSAVTVYSLTQKLAQTSGMFISKIGVALMPGLAEILATGDMARLQRATLRLMRILGRVSMLAFVLLAVLNGRFVELWVGPQYFGGLLLSLLFACVVLRNGLIGTYASYLYSSGELSAWGWLSMAEAVAKIALTVVLLPRLGIIAPAIGTAVGGVITGVYLIFKIASMTGLNPRAWITEGILPPLLKSAPSMLAVVIADRLVPSSWGWVGLASIASLALLVNTISFDRGRWARVRPAIGLMAKGSDAAPREPDDVSVDR